MTPRARHLTFVLLPAALAALSASPALAYDYPTSERVLYVEQCIRDNPGPHYEMVSKCSCALDAMAKTTPYDAFVSMETSTYASNIGGERGNAIRDAENLQKEVRAFRVLQDEAKKGCFIGFVPPIH